jgi:hypothetical protein
MRRFALRLLFAAGLGCASLAVAAVPASADVISPPGACAGSGTWVNGQFSENSASHVPSDVIKVPLKDTVRWAGSEHGAPLGSKAARREIAGSVWITFPLGQKATVESWGGSSVRYANTGEHKYNFPSVLGGLKIKLSGEHKDGGKLTCSGSVYLQLEGGGFKNPLAWAGLGGMVVTAAGLMFAGRPVVRKIWAFEDTNPG